MSKKPFDLLVTDKEPLLFIEKSLVRVDDGELVVLNKNGKFVIQPASTLCLYLGAGTSITQEAAIMCALHDCFISFSRDFSGNDEVNKRLNLLNNALYSIVTSIILAIGLHPSVGYIHGKKRRGGLAFDLADIYKYELTIKPAFRMPQTLSFKEIMYYFSAEIKSENFKIIKEIVEICLNIANGETEV